MAFRRRRARTRPCGHRVDLVRVQCRQHVPEPEQDRRDDAPASRRTRREQRRQDRSERDLLENGGSERDPHERLPRELAHGGVDATILVEVVERRHQHHDREHHGGGDEQARDRRRAAAPLDEPRLLRRRRDKWHHDGAGHAATASGAAAPRSVSCLFVATAVVLAIAVLMPAFHDLYEDRRVDTAVGEHAWQTLVRIPLGTVVLEEVDRLRSVTPALFATRLGVMRASLVASVLFGFWHVLPALQLNEINPVMTDLFGRGAGGLATGGDLHGGRRHDDRRLLVVLDPLPRQERAGEDDRPRRHELDRLHRGVPGQVVLVACLFMVDVRQRLRQPQPFTAHHDLLPGEDVVYIGDTHQFPYSRRRRYAECAHGAQPEPGRGLRSQGRRASPATPRPPRRCTDLRGMGSRCRWWRASLKPWRANHTSPTTRTGCGWGLRHRHGSARSARVRTNTPVAATRADVVPSVDGLSRLRRVRGTGGRPCDGGGDHDPHRASSARRSRTPSIDTLVLGLHRDHLHHT